MTKAVRNMMVNQCLARALSVSLRVVEPFSPDSSLLHSPTLWDGHSPKFSDYYNLSFYNHMSEKEEGVPLVTWEEFLDRAPREVIVLVVLIEQPCKTLSPTSEFNGPKGTSENVIECIFHSDTLDSLVTYNFTIVNTLYLNCTYLHKAFELDELKQQIYGDRDISEVTVVSTCLRPYNFVHSWVKIPTICHAPVQLRSDSRLIPSSSVLRHTEDYVTYLRGNRNVTTIAVMFRFERYFEQHTKSEESLIECLNETVILYDQLKQQHSNSIAFITLDFGRFGSDGMQTKRMSKTIGIAEGIMSKRILDTLQHLSDGQWSMEQWEETFVRATGGITDKLYIAMLQQSIATHSDCLILVGGGGYQEVTARQYINKHGRACFHTVGMLGIRKKTFDSILTS